MANVYKRIFNNAGALLAAGITTYTVPASTSALISSARVVNTSTTLSNTLTVYQGGTTAPYTILSTVTLLPGESVTINDFQMDTADTLSFNAGTAALLSVIVHGALIT